MMADWILFSVSAWWYTTRRRRETGNLPIQLTESCDKHPQELETNEKWDYHEDLERFVRFTPKVELHVHLDGSFDAGQLYELLLKNEKALYCLPVSTTLPWDQSVLPVRQLVQDCQSADEYRAICTCRGRKSLHEMLKCFELFLPLVRGRLDLLQELAYDFCQRQAQQHIVYTEVRYSPHLLCHHGALSNGAVEPCTAQAVLEAITEGLRRGCHDFGIVVNQILCMITWRPEWAMSTVELAHSRRYDYPCPVVGVDVAAGEEHFDAGKFPHLHRPHQEALAKAHALGLNITMHAGENETAENVVTSIETYHAKRIGHGYRLLTRPDLLERIPPHIHLEICPTSSVETGGWEFSDRADAWLYHPAVYFLRRRQLSCSLSSDDPAVFNTSLTWQWRIALGKMRLTRDELVTMNWNAIDAAFCSPEVKGKLHCALTEYLEHTQPPDLLKLHSFTDRVGDTSSDKEDENS